MKVKAGNKLKRVNFGSTDLAAKPKLTIALLMDSPVGKLERGYTESTDKTQKAKIRVCWVFFS